MSINIHAGTSSSPTVIAVSTILIDCRLQIAERLARPPPLAIQNGKKHGLHGCQEGMEGTRDRPLQMSRASAVSAKTQLPMGLLASIQASASRGTGSLILPVMLRALAHRANLLTASGRSQLHACLVVRVRRQPARVCVCVYVILYFYTSDNAEGGRRQMTTTLPPIQETGTRISALYNVVTCDCLLEFCIN